MGLIRLAASREIRCETGRSRGLQERRRQSRAIVKRPPVTFRGSFIPLAWVRHRHKTHHVRIGAAPSTARPRQSQQQRQSNPATRAGHPGDGEWQTAHDVDDARAGGGGEAATGSAGLAAASTGYAHGQQCDAARGLPSERQGAGAAIDQWEPGSQQFALGQLVAARRWPSEWTSLGGVTVLGALLRHEPSATTGHPRSHVGRRFRLLGSRGQRRRRRNGGGRRSERLTRPG